jgi:tRNA (mo5U34)-methyltransferase
MTPLEPEVADGDGGPPDGAWTPDRLRAEVATRTWFHTIDLGSGVVTPGQKDTATELVHMRLPDLTGRSVLDIGTYDGFYAFEAERRGAARVLATDSWTWNWPGSDARRNFDLAHEVLGSRVVSQVIAVEDLSPEAVGGPFDVVLFLGVLYHAPDPLGYLRRLRSVTGGTAVIETVVDLLDVDVPAVAYYPGASLNGDASNHFGPNPAAVEGLLTDAGFARVDAFRPWASEKDWAMLVQPAASARGPLARVRRRLRRPRSGRMVFHAHV